MKLIATTSNSNSQNTHTFNRNISLEPQKLITQINSFASLLKDEIKNDILETIAITGKTPADISVMLICDDLVLGFSQKISLEIGDGLSDKIERILYDFSYSIKKEISFEIICSTDFRNQKVRKPTTIKRLGK